MRVVLKVPGFDKIRIDGEAQEVADLLFALHGRALSPVATGIDKGGGEEGAVPPLPKAMTDRASRPYGGTLNRRDMMLRVFRSWSEEGVASPSLDQLINRFQSLFPDSPTKHLDQVVRDLVNKTSLVERSDWGHFRLTESND